jgi:hypothetical protein
VTKPRFTPDPIPDGLDPELAAYLQRQFNRIDDWWPKDLEDRVKALEEIASRVGGVWPIVDYSRVSIRATSFVASLSCGNDVDLIETIVHPGRTGTLSDTIISQSGGYVWMSFNAIGWPSLVRIDPVTKSSTAYEIGSYSDSIVAEGLFISDDGYVGRGDYLVFAWGSFSTDIDIWDIKSGTPTFYKQRGKFNYLQDFSAESESYVVLTNPGGFSRTFRMVLKSDLLNVLASGDVVETEVTLPSGYDGKTPRFAYAGSDDFIFLSYNSTSNLWGTFHLDSSLNLTGPIDTLSGSSSTFESAGIYTPYGCIFQEYPDGTTNPMYARKINLDGTFGSSTALGGYRATYNYLPLAQGKYDADTKSIFWCLKSTSSTDTQELSYLVRYMPEVDGVQNCTPDYIGTYPGHYSTGGIYAEGNCYVSAYHSGVGEDENESEIFAITASV